MSPAGVEVGRVSSVAIGRGSEARVAVVAGADLWWAGARVPRRCGDARVARDDLSVVVRAVPRRVTQGVDPLSPHATFSSPSGRLPEARPQRSGPDPQPRAHQ